MVCGVDEAGRGPLAGPVYAAAVILDRKRRINGLADSKVLPAERREVLAGRIKERAVAWAVASASVEEIDRINIFHASMLAMRRAVQQLGVRPEDISVETICVPLDVASGEQLHRVGAALNALAVIAGDGELREVGGESVVDLDSVFRALPVWQNLGSRPLQIGDTIPAGRLRPSRIAEQLNDLWGKQAVLAVALRRSGLPFRLANRTPPSCFPRSGDRSCSAARCARHNHQRWRSKPKRHRRSLFEPFS